MKRIATWATVLGLVALFGVVVVPQAAQATVTQPTKVAVIVMENRNYASITSGCPNATYICTNLVPGAGQDFSTLGGISLTNMFNGAVDANNNASGICQSGGGADCAQAFSASGQQYADMSSADNCNGWADDSQGNSGSFPLGPTHATFTGTSCGTGFTVGPDLNAQMDAAGVTWASYAEGFGLGVKQNPTGDASNGTVNEACNATQEPTQAGKTSNTVLTGDKNLGYIRRHVPSTFWNDINTDCAIAATTGGASTTSHIQDFPGLTTDTSFNGADAHEITAINNGTIDPPAAMEKGCSGASCTQVYPFVGFNSFDGTHYTTGLPQFSWIIPSGCHDMHTKGGTMAPFGPCHAENVPGESPPVTVDGSTSQTVQAAGDDWLSKNLPSILDDLGSTGVAVITWDEGAAGSHQIATFIVPGTGGTLACAQTQACTSTRYNHASAYVAYADAFGLLGKGATYGCGASATDSFGQYNCTHAGSLPENVGSGQHELPITMGGGCVSNCNVTTHYSVTSFSQPTTDESQGWTFDHGDGTGGRAVTGVATKFTVTALDSSNEVDTTNTSSVTVTATDGANVSHALAAGVYTFTTLSFSTGETQTLTASDGTNTGTLTGITVDTDTGNTPAWQLKSTIGIGNSATWTTPAWSSNATSGDLEIIVVTNNGGSSDAPSCPTGSAGGTWSTLESVNNFAICDRITTATTKTFTGSLPSTLHWTATAFEYSNVGSATPIQQSYFSSGSGTGAGCSVGPDTTMLTKTHGIDFQSLWVDDGSAGSYDEAALIQPTQAARIGNNDSTRQAMFDSDGVWQTVLSGQGSLDIGWGPIARYRCAALEFQGS